MYQLSFEHDICLQGEQEQVQNLHEKVCVVAYKQVLSPLLASGDDTNTPPSTSAASPVANAQQMSPAPQTQAAPLRPVAVQALFSKHSPNKQLSDDGEYKSTSSSPQQSINAVHAQLYGTGKVPWLAAVSPEQRLPQSARSSCSNSPRKADQLAKAVLQRRPWSAGSSLYKLPDAGQWADTLALEDPRKPWSPDTSPSRQLPDAGEWISNSSAGGSPPAAQLAETPSTLWLKDTSSKFTLLDAGNLGNAPMLTTSQQAHDLQSGDPSTTPSPTTHRQGLETISSGWHRGSSQPLLTAVLARRQRPASPEFPPGVPPLFGLQTRSQGTSQAHLGLNQPSNPDGVPNTGIPSSIAHAGCDELPAGTQAASLPRHPPGYSPLPPLRESFIASQDVKLPETQTVSVSSALASRHPDL